MVTIDRIKGQMVELEAAGAPQIAPDAWTTLVKEFQALLAEFETAREDGKISLGEALGLAKDAITIAASVAALVSQLFAPPTPETEAEAVTPAEPVADENPAVGEAPTD